MKPTSNQLGAMMLTDDQITAACTAYTRASGTLRDVMRDVLKAALTAAPAQSGEPVTWALRIGDSPSWAYMQLESDADFYGKQSGFKYEKRPLYAAPQPTQPVKGGDMTVQFDDPRVQVVYELVCGEESPPPGQHWDGWVSRRIVDALFPPSAKVLDGERAAHESQAPTGHYDGDTEESRAAFRDYDKRVLVRTRSTWQIWRDACAWQARAASPQATATQADEQRLVQEIRQWAAKQKPLDAASAKVLYDNLWDLYARDDAAQPATGAPDA